MALNFSKSSKDVSRCKMAATEYVSDIYKNHAEICYQTVTISPISQNIRICTGY